MGKRNFPHASGQKSWVGVKPASNSLQNNSFKLPEPQKSSPIKWG